MTDLYSHSLLRSMACWRGESSTSAFGGDWLPSAISDPDSGAAAPAAFLPAASAAALSCCGEGFVPFLPFPVSLQARNEQNEICELIFHTSPRVCHGRVASKRDRSSLPAYPIEVRVSIGSWVLRRRGMFLSRMMEWRINRHSIGRRFHQKALETTALFFFSSATRIFSE